jgi:hypothetical protein
MNDREPPGYDDWFDEPEPPTLEQGRAGRQSYDAPHEPEEDVWTLPEDESRRSRRSHRSGGVTVGGHSLTATQIAIIAIAVLAIIIAILAAAGVFSSDSTPTTPSISTPTTVSTPTTTATTPTITAPHQTMQLNDTGPQVVLLQRELIHLGYLQPPADGIYGSGTLDAVKAFQTDNGLSADGIVGQDTLTALQAQANASANANAG